MKPTTAAAAAAAALWVLFVAASPRWFFPAAAPFCAVWIALSARAAPGLAARLRPRWGDLGLALSTALLLYAGARAFLWAGCGGVSDALCAPLASMSVRFQTRGVGPALVLLHGIGASLESWMLNLDPLSRRFRVYTPDLVWFGRTEKPAGEITAEAFSDFVAGAIVGTVVGVVVGNSFLRVIRNPTPASHGDDLRRDTAPPLL